MAIYTRFGDAGRSRRVDGQVVPKSDPRLAAGGELDELNAWIALARRSAAEASLPEVAEPLDTVQHELFQLGEVLAALGTERPAAAGALDESVSRMEARIDETWAGLPAPEGFVLPGGGETACRVHLARAVCRRAERAVVALGRDTELPPAALRYLNRLGDLLFVLARRANRDQGIADEPPARREP